MNREIVNHFDREFARLLQSLKEIVRSVPVDLLYRNPPAPSIGESILRSAAVVEQTCGGLTANLWDDPFEWTLPEALASAELIVGYLSEVDLVRQRAFRSIGDDAALTKYISVPSGEPCLLVSLLIETLVSASDHRGRSRATLKILSEEGASGFII
jgi:hypothetical protein